MKLEVGLITVLVFGIISDITAETLEGSGNELNTDDSDDIYLNEDTGSGITETVSRNMNCSLATLYCWCMYPNGTEVLGTRLYSKKPDCSNYTRQSHVLQNSRYIPESQSNLDVEVGSNQASEPDELYFDDEQRVESSSTTTKSTGTGNKLGVPKRTSVDANHNKSEDDPKDAGDDEDDKKDARQTKAQASKSDPDDPGKEVKEEIVLGSLSHPGIMAALIGGGLVGLLCAILLIIFIVYRMRKKDEGSYPLDDGKPLKGYAYSKAPSQEFYA